MNAFAYRFAGVPLLMFLAVCGRMGAPGTNGGSSGGSGAARETLVWSDEFNAAQESTAPDTQNWTYETGAGGWGNRELETYCAYGSTTAPCDAKNPNAYVGTEGYLHIVARNPSKDVYTSARLKSQGLQSFQYGRLEARIKIPEGQGMWPAFWMLGDNISSVDWPACGEMDIMESVGTHPSTNWGSIHGTGFIGKPLTTEYNLPNNAKFGDTFHTFGIVWAPKLIKFYVDNPKNVYATYTPKNLPQGAVWPFDTGRFFFILNVAVGGAWPGAPDNTTVFPQEMLVDYVRVYGEPAT